MLVLGIVEETFQEHALCSFWWKKWRALRLHKLVKLVNSKWVIWPSLTLKLLLPSSRSRAYEAWRKMERTAETYAFVPKIRSKCKWELTFSCSKSFFGSHPSLPGTLFGCWVELILYRTEETFQEHALCSFWWKKWRALRLHKLVKLVNSKWVIWPSLTLKLLLPSSRSRAYKAWRKMERTAET